MADELGLGDADPISGPTVTPRPIPRRAELTPDNTL
jgi:hypothetical protein